MDLKIDPAVLDEEYYRPFFEFLQQDQRTVTSSGRTAVVRPILYDPIDMQVIYIGLDEGLHSILRRRGAIPFRVREYEDANLYIANDGVAIASSPGVNDL